ncbi:MAG: peptidoglycan-binding domain-containing protein [Pikeienuella sp.]
MKSILMASVCAFALSACVEGGSSDLQAQLDAANAKSADLEAQVASLVLRGGAAAPSGAGGPVNAKPGECYARITQPAQTKTVEERVVDRDATAKLKVIPATYKKVKEKVIVKEASQRIEVVPATYKTVKERVIVTPAKTELITVPATYKTVTEKVKVRDAYTTWKPGGSVIAVGANALGGTILQNRRSSTGEVMCLVEIPAEYKMVKRRVEVTPATTREKVTPAVYKTVTKRVVDKPASTRTVDIPAVYGTVTKTVEATPSVVQRTEIPASYKTVKRTVEVAPARTVWTSVLCDVNTTPDVVRRLQTALKSQGHYNGKIDGDVGPATRRAIASYQNAQGVQSDILTIESARALGII